MIIKQIKVAQYFSLNFVLIFIRYSIFNGIFIPLNVLDRKSLEQRPTKLIP